MYFCCMSEQNEQMLQVPVPKELFTRWKIALLKNGETQKFAVQELINYYLQEFELKEDDKK